MTLTDLLRTCDTAGIVLVAAGEMLEVEAPAEALTPELRESLQARKPDLLPVLWRLAAMRRLAHEAPKAVVYARPEARGGPGHCFSCGDPLGHPEAYGRCGPCDIASEVYYASRQTDGDVEAVA